MIGAFVSGLKLSRRCLALWREVLERVPRAKLAFSPVNPGARALYCGSPRPRGIAAERLLFVPQGRDDAENQARYRLVDFVLDPMPYGGVNGTLEALDMGVPVVTLVGAGTASGRRIRSSPISASPRPSRKAAASTSTSPCGSPTTPRSWPGCARRSAALADRRSPTWPRTRGTSRRPTSRRSRERCPDVVAASAPAMADDALALAQAAAAAAPTDAALQFRLAETQADAGQLAAAIASLRTAFGCGPTMRRPMPIWDSCSPTRGDNEGAIASLRQRSR